MSTKPVNQQQTILNSVTENPAGSASASVVTVYSSTQQQEAKINQTVTQQQINDALNQKNAVQSPPQPPLITTNTKITTVYSPYKSASPIVKNNKNTVYPQSLTVNDIVNVVFPYVRSNTIKFNATKLKPNTRYYAFFGEYNVTDFCHTGNVSANVSGFSSTYVTSKLESAKLAGSSIANNAPSITAEVGNIFSDYRGIVNGVFKFEPSIGLKIPSGSVIFRLTDSPTNGEDKESYADAIFSSNGRLTNFTPQPQPQTYTNVSFDYGEGGTSSSGGNNSNTPINTNPSTQAGTYGWLDSHISYLLSIPESAITDEQRNYYGNMYKSSEYGYVFNDATLQSVVPGAINYETVSTRQQQSYNFSPMSSKNGTATNILTATNQSTGKTYVNDLKTQVISKGGQTAWDMTVASYEGTKAATTDIVNSGKATQEMKDFYLAGIANGTFTNDQAGINKAIDNWSATVTLGMLDQAVNSATKASSDTIANGFSPNQTTKSTTNNSLQTSTSTKTVSTILKGIV